MRAQHDEHAARAAGNQILFREVNERLEGLASTFAHVARTAAFTCECADVGCIDPIKMTIDEYEAVRQEPTHFAVAAAHVDFEVEDIVRRGDGYVVVAKRGEAAALAAGADPRVTQRQS